MLGSIQSKLYNAMLKGNKIPSGIANYVQVVDMIIAFEYGHLTEFVSVSE